MWLKFAPATRHLCRLIVLVICAGFVLGPYAGAALASDLPVSVRGSVLYKGNRPWIPRGVVLVAFVAPKSALRGPFIQARRKFGAAELTRVRQFGADLVRFQVSQSAIDPASPRYSRQYVEDVVHAVDLARSMDFAVIVSLQLRPFEPGYGLPSAATVRAWQQLAPRFAEDRGIMLELYNEPTLRQPTPSNWSAWQRAFQPVIDAVRAAGSRNVLIVDGLRAAKILDGAPQLEDRLSRIVYAVHPYPGKGNTTRSDWDRNFGRFADLHPVLATEWNALPRAGCSAATPEIAANLLSYLRGKHIGVVGWAFDYPGTLFAGDSMVPTNYRRFVCGPGGEGGGGELLQQFFHRQ